MEIDVSKLLERIRKFSMPDGEIRGRQVRLRQVGELRLGPERPWRPFRAHQVFNGSSLDFRWQAWMKLVPLLPTRVVDAFLVGKRQSRCAGRRKRHLLLPDA
jgi:hypothetical protein